MKKIFLITLLLASIVFSEINVISPSGTYFLGDNIYLIGNYQGDCSGHVALKLDGKLIDEKNYSFTGVTDLKKVFPKKINASVGSHFLELKSNCFEPVVKNFKITNVIPINYGLNSFGFMTGEKLSIEAYGIKEKTLLPCSIIIENKTYINKTSYAFNTPGVKEIKLIAEDKYGNKGEKTLYVKVFDELKGEAFANKLNLNPGENLTIKLEVVDFFNRSINYTATANLFNKSYQFQKNNSKESILIVPIKEDTPPGDYEAKIQFNQGKNKGNLTLNFHIKNKPIDIEIIKDEKKSTNTNAFVKVILFNQVHETFNAIVNVTIQRKGKTRNMQTETGKYFSVLPGSKITATYEGISTSKKIEQKKQNKESTDGNNKEISGLAVGASKYKNDYLTWGILTFLIIISIFFLRNSELLTEA